MGTENESSSQVVTAIADAVSSAASTSAPVAGGKESKEEKLDVQAELFVRKISDNITKALADMLKPAAAPTKSEGDDDDDDDDAEDSPVRRKKRKPSAPQSQAQKPTFWASIGLG